MRTRTPESARRATDTPSQCVPRPRLRPVCAGVLCAAIAALAAIAQPAPAQGGIDAAEAGRIFKEVRALCDRDGGALWGTTLDGPLLLLDENTGDVVANGPDYQNRLKSKGEAFAGVLHDADKISDNLLRWAGVTWTVLAWPLPEDPFARNKLILHECYGRIADRLGVPAGKVANDQLDTKDGRLWLQLEWRALNKALVGSKDGRKRAAQDALVFRAYRRSLFSGSAETERVAEARDGLGEYTGVVLGTKNRAEATAYAAGSLLGAQSLPVFSHIFSYLSGPAYGLLLDDAKPGWQKTFAGTDDLGTLLAAALGVIPPEDLKATAEGRASAYGGKELAAAEEKAAARKREEAAAIRARFVEGPVLDIPTARGFNYSYDAAGKVPIPGLGTVYAYVRVFAAWGSLEADEGALLLVKEGQVAGIRVPAPKDPSARPVVGEGWTLKLQPGWKLFPGQRAGDWELREALAGAP